MEIRINVTKEERKALVKAAGEILGATPEYQGAPTFAFAVGGYVVDRHGTLTLGEGADESEVRELVAGLAAKGYVADGYSVGDTGTSDDSGGSKGEGSRSEFGSLRSVVDEDGVNLVIEVPFAGFTPVSLSNLERLVEGKSGLIKKAIGADTLPVEQAGETLRFPWFPQISSNSEADAYARFVHALCELAKKQKRVTMREKPQDGDSSEKFAFRCFLLRLGFIGKEYASARKILLSRLSGSGSFKNGNKKAVTDEPSAETTVDVFADNVLADCENGCPSSINGANHSARLNTY